MGSAFEGFVWVYALDDKECGRLDRGHSGVLARVRDVVVAERRLATSPRGI